MSHWGDEPRVLGVWDYVIDGFFGMIVGAVISLWILSDFHDLTMTQFWWWFAAGTASAAVGAAAWGRGFTEGLLWTWSAPWRWWRRW